MGDFTKVTSESLDLVQVNAGMVLTSFDPNSPTAPTAATVLCATTGGITANCTPTFEDFGEDIDNCPNNTMEMKRITGYECTLSFTALDMSGEVFKAAVGAAALFAETSSRPEYVVPSAQVVPANFSDLWFVSERVDDKIIAIKLKNALSTGGFSYKTQKNGKGQLTVTFTGHISISDPDDVPMLFYVCDAEGYTPDPDNP